MAKRTRGNEPPKVICSVCGKSQHEARRMPQATNTVILCDSCIRLFHEIVVEEENAALEARQPKPHFGPYSPF
jgi:ATP-dependent protease Clp ATPase subunit